MIYRNCLCALYALSLAGCGSTQQATVSAQNLWTGRPADQFFAKNGPPKRQYTMASGAKVYSWETLSLSPLGTQQMVCTADILSDPRGLITEIRMQEDSIGLWNTSRCTEVFSSP